MNTHRSHQTRQKSEGENNIQISNSKDISITQHHDYRLDIESQRSYRERCFILEKIRGLAKKNLENSLEIKLELEESMDALVPSPRVTSYQFSKTVEKYGDIQEAFNDSRGSLLVLGEPGAGKTTTLLSLTKSLIKVADENNSEPIPIFLSLSTWTQSKSLEEWILRELLDIYAIPVVIGRECLKNHEFLLLLDSLDEVGTKIQELCVIEIMKFRKEHMIKLVVSSRRSDYFRLDTRLDFELAITILPLTYDQADLILEKSGGEFDEIRNIINSDSELQELITTPLMINIIIWTQQNGGLIEARSGWGWYTTRNKLIENFVHQTIHSRVQNPIFSPEKSLKWLNRLAHRMNASMRYSFSAEKILPLLKTPEQDFLSLLDIFLVIIIGVLVIAAVTNFSAAGVGLLLAFIGVNIWNMVNNRGATFRPSGLLSWSWGQAGSALKFHLILLFFYTAYGSTYFGLLGGLAMGMVITLGSILLNGYSSFNLRTKKTDGILRQSLKTSVLMGALMSMVVFLFELPLGVIQGVFSIIFPTTLLMGTTAWMYYGGFFLINHFVFQVYLKARDEIPWRLDGFIDFVSERFLIRETDGDYEFTHGLIMEYIEGMEVGKRLSFRRLFPFPEVDITGDPQKYFHLESDERKYRNIYAGIFSVCIMIGLVLTFIPRHLADFYTSAGIISTRLDRYDASVSFFEKAIEIEPDNPLRWNNLCWFGSIMGHVDDVVSDCDKAISLSPTDSKTGYIYRDSRGLSRALTGDHAGAIEDFIFFVENAPPERTSAIEQRKKWISQLKASVMPFDETELKKLLNETTYP